MFHISYKGIIYKDSIFFNYSHSCGIDVKNVIKKKIFGILMPNEIQTKKHLKDKMLSILRQKTCQCVGEKCKTLNVNRIFDVKKNKKKWRKKGFCMKKKTTFAP